jgi:hypothetical protein
MGVSLTYATAQPVSHEAREFVRRAADEINHARDWWGEGILFIDAPSQPSCLVGDSKLFRVISDWDDDTFLAWRDAQFIVANLTKWASSFGLTWNLSVEGEKIGTVNATGADKDANEFLSNLAAVVSYPTTDEQTVEKIAGALLRKYSTPDE